MEKGRPKKKVGLPSFSPRSLSSFHPFFMRERKEGEDKKEEIPRSDKKESAAAARLFVLKAKWHGEEEEEEKMGIKR